MFGWSVGRTGGGWMNDWLVGWKNRRRMVGWLAGGIGG